jgi:hypothetical protein
VALATTALMTGVVLAGATAHADETSPAAGFAGLSGFDAQGVAAMVDFQYQYAQIGVIPFTVQGGVLQSVSDASSSGNARGVAGPMPIPLLANGSLANPTNDPITGQPVPEEIRNGYSKIDFQRLPNACQSQYPDIYGEGSEEANCGGPASNDPAMGFTFGAANGHTKSSGDEDDPLKTKSKSTSRGTDVFLPALQATLHDAWAESTSGTNRDGLAESRSIVEIDSVKLLNGLVELAGLRSQALAVADGTEQGSKATTAFSLREAFVAGFPVVIGPDGVAVNKEKLSPGTSPAEATKQVTEALHAADLNIRLAPPPAATKAGSQVSIASMGVEIQHQGTKVTPANSYYRFPYVFVAANATANTGESYGAGTGIDTGSTPIASTDSGASTTSDLSGAPAGSDATGGDSGLSYTGEASPGSDLSTGASADSAVPAGDTTASSAGSGVEATAPSTGAASGEAVAQGRLATPRRYSAIPAAHGLPVADMKDLAAMVAITTLVALAGLGLRRVVL